MFSFEVEQSSVDESFNLHKRNDTRYKKMNEYNVFS